MELERVVSALERLENAARDLDSLLTPCAPLSLEKHAQQLTSVRLALVARTHVTSSTPDDEAFMEATAEFAERWVANKAVTLALTQIEAADAWTRWFVGCVPALPVEDSPEIQPVRIEGHFNGVVSAQPKVSLEGESRAGPMGKDIAASLAGESGNRPRKIVKPPSN